MKLIQTPSLITGVILGASLITLSAASNDSAPEDLNVFFPGTEVSSADVNANFTYLDDEVTTLEGRVDNLEGSLDGSETLYFEFEWDGTFSLTVPDGYCYVIKDGSAIGADWFGANALQTIGSSSSFSMPILLSGVSPVDLSFSYASSIVGIRLTPGATVTFTDAGQVLYNCNLSVEKIPYAPLQNQ